jgi:hypothetical protein
MKRALQAPGDNFIKSEIRKIYLLIKKKKNKKKIQFKLNFKINIQI